VDFSTRTATSDGDDQFGPESAQRIQEQKLVIKTGDALRWTMTIMGLGGREREREIEKCLGPLCIDLFNNESAEHGTRRDNSYPNT